MKQDLRYLERLIVKDIKLTEHPSDEYLAGFIDGKLDNEQREKIFEHLVLCDTCSDIVATTAPKTSKMKRLSRSKLQVINVFMAMAASVLLFVFISFPDGSELGMINLSEGLSTSGYKAPLNDVNMQKKIDADKHLIKIISATDMHKVKHYKEAVKLENKELYVEARAMYKQAFIPIRHNPNAKERIKQKIVINYRLLKLGLKEKRETDVSIKEYKDMLRYDIGIYVLQYQGK